MSKNESLIREVRENFQYVADYWREIRDEARVDMRYVAGDPWDPKERRERQENGRLCIAPDELNQYLNQLINDVRQNKRSVKVIPLGSGANDKTAEFRQNLIRQIEYKSNAQAAYATGFENAVQRSYGAWRVSKQYVSPRDFEQELVIRRIPNPDSVYFDPDAREADCSDGKIAFVVDRLRRSQFKRKYPGATIADFTMEHMEVAPLWIGEDWVQIAEYWRVKAVRRTLLLLEMPSEVEGERPTIEKCFLDELPKGTTLQDSACYLPDGQVLALHNDRTTDDSRVEQVITNGIEALEENPWDGRWIPLIPCWGKEIFVDDGSGAKRIIMSLTRLARDPQMLYAYYRTAQAECVGMTPKTPYIGYEGQFDGHEDKWEEVNRKPFPYLEVRAMTELSGDRPLPLPQRAEYRPPVMELESGAEAARRAIQAAMGMYNSSVGRLDTSARSGKAIDSLDRQSDQGSFHFIDNYDRALEHTGRILDDLIKFTYDTPRDVGTRTPNDEFAKVRIMEPYTDEKTGEQLEHRTDVGEHDVTITTGPSFQSQREEAAAFAEALIDTPFAERIMDLLVKLRNLGPIGDEIAKRLTPPEFAEQNGEQQLSPQAAQQLQAIQQQLEAAIASGQQLAAELQQAKSGENLKRLEIESRERIAALNAEVQLAIKDADLAGRERLAVLEGKIDAILNPPAAEAPEATPAPEADQLPLAA